MFQSLDPLKPDLVCQSKPHFSKELKFSVKNSKPGSGSSLLFPLVRFCTSPASLCYAGPGLDHVFRSLSLRQELVLVFLMGELTQWKG